MQKGFVQSRTAGSLLNSGTVVNWYPESQREKHLIKKGRISLPIDAEAWYCWDCMKVIAVYQQKTL